MALLNLFNSPQGFNALPTDVAGNSSGIYTGPAWQAGFPGNAGGGLVSGPGSGTSDSILARLSNGEFVVTADAARKYWPMLEAMNSRHFAAGGWVPGDEGKTETWIGEILR